MSERATGVCEKLVRELERQLLFGEIRPGGKLPSQRVLAERFGISRASVREAVTTLENRGLIETVHGGGSFSRNLLADFYQLPAAEGEQGSAALQQQVMELREMLEGEAAYFAARRATDAQLAALTAEYGRMLARRAGETTLAKAKADLTFHLLIAQSSHHLLVMSISQVLYTKYFSVIYGVLSHNLKKTGRYPAKIGSQHTEIYRAILARDAERARTLAQEHIAYTRGQLQRPG